MLAFKFHFHFGPLIGGLADALGLGGVLQFVHSQKRAVAGALQILGAHPAAEDIVAAALEAYAGNKLESCRVSALMRRECLPVRTYSFGSQPRA